MGNRRVTRNFRLQHVLDGSIRQRVAKLRGRDREGARSLTVPDGLSGYAVFCQLSDERAGQDKVEELVDLSHHRALGALLPCWPPEDGEDFDGGKQGAVPVREFRGCGRCRRRDFGRGWAYCLREKQRYDANRINTGGINLLSDIEIVNHSELPK